MKLDYLIEKYGYINEVVRNKPYKDDLIIIDISIVPVNLAYRDRFNELMNQTSDWNVIRKAFKGDDFTIIGHAVESNQTHNTISNKVSHWVEPLSRIKEHFNLDIELN